MKIPALSLALIASPFAASDREDHFAAEVRATLQNAVALSAISTNNAPVSRQMKITIGQRVFAATLEDNAAAAAFKALLPLSLEMRDVNRNEKAFDLTSDLPTADTRPRTIRAGDLMVWSSRTVVVFYKSFSTPYSYTRLGEVNDPAGLAEALGAGKVTVTFEMK